MQDIEIVPSYEDRMLLDLQVRIKNEFDDSLAFRRSCREGVRGSDAMNINGKNGLACITNLNEVTQPILLRPLPGSPVVRDLIVDLTQFWKQYHLIKPYPIMVDSRDTALAERLDNVDDAYRLFRCRTIMNCAEVCPKGLNPARDQQHPRPAGEACDLNTPLSRHIRKCRPLRPLR
jgi:succinate dehydrogenase / fumarate reductase iron-sulfur subunit